jgi:hypothetical protein
VLRFPFFGLANYLYFVKFFMLCFPYFFWFIANFLYFITGGGYNIFWTDEDQRLEVYRGRNAGQKVNFIIAFQPLEDTFTSFESLGIN